MKFRDVLTVFFLFHFIYRPLLEYIQVKGKMPLLEETIHQTQPHLNINYYVKNFNSLFT